MQEIISHTDVGAILRIVHEYIDSPPLEYQDDDVIISEYVPDARDLAGSPAQQGTGDGLSR